MLTAQQRRRLNRRLDQYGRCPHCRTHYLFWARSAQAVLCGTCGHRYTPAQLGLIWCTDGRYSYWRYVP